MIILFQLLNGRNSGELTNPQSDFKYLIAALIPGLFLTQPAYFYFDSALPGHIIWSVSSVGLLIFYALRFMAKREKTTIDILKIPVLILLILYPMTSSASAAFGGSPFWSLLNNMTFYFVATIYFYDRFIIKPYAMNKKFILTLAVQTLFIGVLWAYGFMQKNMAEHNADEAYRQRQISDQIQFENNQLKEELKKCR